MIKYLKKNLLMIIASFISLLTALMFLAYRPCWSGISKALGAEKNPSFFVMNVGLIFTIFAFLAFIFSFLMLFLNKKEKKWPWITSFSLDLFFIIILLVIYFLGANDYFYFIFPNFLKSLCISLVFILFLLILFFNVESKIVKILISTVALVFTIVLGFDIKINYFTFDSVIYAVEDEYQIVYSTNDKSIAWVEVGGEKYYDLYAGSMKSNDKVHKIIVPQEKLDTVKEYTIYAQKMIYRGPFGGYKGKIISIKHTFTPVDITDGINYLALSDVHEAFNPAVKVSEYDKTIDFLVIVGDITSCVDSEFYANATNHISSRITKGEKPVVYARGNHECKGEYSETLYKYVGSKNQKFYYTFRLSNIYGIVLDLGEDHDDDWWECYGTDKYDLYRDEQTLFLEEIKASHEYNLYDYTLVVCHIPIQLVNYRVNHESYKNRWTELLNDMNIDILLCGHQHDINLFEPGVVEPNVPIYYNTNYDPSGERYSKKGYLTDFDFLGVMVGKPGEIQAGDSNGHGSKTYIGTYINVDFVNNRQTIKFVNSKGKVVDSCNIFSTDELKSEHTYPLS